MPNHSEPDVHAILPNLPYESIGEASRAYYAEQWRKKRGAVVAVVAIVLLATLWFAQSNAFTITALVWFCVLLFLCAAAVAAAIQSRGQLMFYRGIAKAWGWYFTDSLALQEFHGSLARVGHSQRVYNVLSDGAPHPAKSIGTLRYAIGREKSERVYVQTYAMIDLKTPLPHVLLAVDKDRFDEHILMAVGRLEPVTLESGFEDFVGLYVEPGLELEALQIFASSVLAHIREVWPAYSFECLDTCMYVYSPGLVDTKAKMDSLAQLLSYLSSQTPRLVAMRGSVTAMQGAAGKERG